MKKLTSILIAIIYLTLSVGIVVNVHYCQGRIANVKLYSLENGCCCGGMETNSSCCSDEIHVFKLEKEQQQAKTVQAPDVQASAIVLQRIIAVFEIEIETTSIPEYPNGPPIETEPLWILNCSLTYYG